MSNKRNILRDLKALGRIEPSAEATERAIERARSSLADQVVKQMPVSRGRLFKPHNIAAALAAAVLIVVIAQSFPSRTTGKFAFAQVQEQVAKTKSVQYVQTERVISRENEKLLEAVRKVMILDGHLKRTEEMQPNHWINIYDAKNGTMLALFPDKKQFSTSKEVNFLDLTDPEKLGTEEIKPDPKAEFYESFRRAPAESAKQLPEQSIDGKLAVGFVVDEKLKGRGGVTTWKRTYWVDPTTKLPIRIETSWRSTDPMVGNSDWVRRDIVFDAPLDLALFSTEPPKGYTDLAAAKPQPDTKKDAESAPGSRLGASLLTPLLFAQVQKEVAKTKSVQYTETLNQPLPGGKPGPTLIGNVTILGDRLKREEKGMQADDRFLQENPYYLGPWGPSIEITDLNKKKKVSLYPEVKGYLSRDWGGTFAGVYILPTEEQKKLEEKAAEVRKEWEASGVKIDDQVTGVFVPDEPNWDASAPLPQLDIYQLISHVPTDQATRLDEKTIGGKRVVGFLVEQDQKLGQRTMKWRHTWWVDPATKLPVRMEINYRSDDPKDAGSQKVISEIVFDATLDGALFSIDLPPGYTDLGPEGKKSAERWQAWAKNPDRMNTMQFTLVENMKTASGAAAPQLTKRVTLLDGHLRREEVELQGAGDAAATSTDGIEPHVRIQDAKQKKSLVLLPGTREYFDPAAGKFVADYVALFKRRTQQTGDQAKAAGKMNLLADLDYPEGKAKRLPLRTINGELAFGKTVEEKTQRGGFTDTRKWTFWLDPFSSQIVRGEVQLMSTDPAVGQVDYVIRDYKVGEPVDPALFSIDPPEGWTDMAAKGAPEKKRIVPPGKAGD